MSFANDNLWFRTLTDFEAYLVRLPRPSWKPIGCTFHNTYRPDAQQWAGRASLVSMQKTYEAKDPPWSSGPHLYLASDTRFDGIFVMTSPTIPGTHAGACNSVRFGCELVGDFQVHAIPEPLLTLAAGAMAALHRYARIATANVWAHRNCMPGRTCPGDAAYAQKAELTVMTQAALNSPTASWEERWGPRATPTAASWPWPLPSFWKQHWTQLGKCQSDAVYELDGQVITQYFAGGYVTEVAGHCALELYPAPVRPVV